VQKMRCINQFWLVPELFLQVILHRLHIVVDVGLNGLDAGSVVFRKAGGERVQKLNRRARQGPHFGHAAGARQQFQPFNLNQHAVAHQRVFAEKTGQTGGFPAVAAIHGADGGERGQIHPNSCKQLIILHPPYPLSSGPAIQRPNHPTTGDTQS